MKNLFLVLFLSLFVSVGFSVKDEPQTDVAKMHISKLKKGMLLVRLYDKHNVIAALKEKGMMTRAKAVEKRQKKLNKEIALAFKNFKFCDVYFFYSSDSEPLKTGNYKAVKLYHNQDSLVADVELDSNFLVADFGMLEGKNVKLETNKKSETPSRASKVKKYKGTSTNTRMRCMIIKSNKLTQLQGPFPYYVRFHPNPLAQRTYAEVVVEMEKKLNNFYKN